MPARPAALLAVVLAAFATLSAPVSVAATPPRTLEAAGLMLRLPPGWQPRTATSSMRAAELVVPGADGAADAEVVLFHFGPGQGGDFDANAARWLGQLDLEPGSEPVRGELASVGDLRIRWIEAEGTLLPSRMGPGPKRPVPGSRLIGAMLEGTGGPWFLKLTGPAPTAAAARESFRMMLRSAAATTLRAPPLATPAPEPKVPGKLADPDLGNPTHR